MGKTERIQVTTTDEMGCDMQIEDATKPEGWRWTAVCPFSRERFGHGCLGHCAHAVRLGRTVSMPEEPARRADGTIKAPPAEVA